MKKVLAALLLVLLVLTVAAPAYADDGGRDGRVAFGKDIVIRSGELLTGDAVAFGGNITVESGGRVDGSIVSFGGNVTVGGEVAESVVSFGGDVDLQAGSLVRQDALAFSGAVRQAQGARVLGNVNSGWTFNVRGRSPTIQVDPNVVPGALDAGNWGRSMIVSAFLDVFRSILTVLVLVALSLILVALFPRQTETVKATAAAQPMPSLGVGCFTYLAAAPVGILLVITCIGPFLLGAVLFAASVFGLAALGLWLGERFLTGVRSGGAARPYSALAATALGTFLITLTVATASAVPFINCFAWIFWLVVGSLGLGAVILSKFGTQLPVGVAPPVPALPPMPAEPVPPPPASPPAEPPAA